MCIVFPCGGHRLAGVDPESRRVRIPAGSPSGRVVLRIRRVVRTESDTIRNAPRAEFAEPLRNRWPTTSGADRLVDIVANSQSSPRTRV